MDQFVTLTTKFKVFFRVILESLRDERSIYQNIRQSYWLVSYYSMGKLLSYTVTILETEQINRRTL